MEKGPGAVKGPAAAGKGSGAGESTKPQGRYEPPPAVPDKKGTPGFTIGDHVRTVKLEKLPHFNHNMAVVMTPLDPEGKHKIQLRPKGQNLKMFPSRLEKVTEEQYLAENPNGDAPIQGVLQDALKQYGTFVPAPAAASTNASAPPADDDKASPPEPDETAPPEPSAMDEAPTKETPAKVDTVLGPPAPVVVDEMPPPSPAAVTQERQEAEQSMSSPRPANETRKTSFSFGTGPNDEDAPPENEVAAPSPTNDPSKPTSTRNSASVAGGGLQRDLDLTRKSFGFGATSKNGNAPDADGDPFAFHPPDVKERPGEPSPPTTGSAAAIQGISVGSSISAIAPRGAEQTASGAEPVINIKGAVAERSTSLETSPGQLQLPVRDRGSIITTVSISTGAPTEAPSSPAALLSMRSLQDVSTPAAADSPTTSTGGGSTRKSSAKGSFRFQRSMTSALKEDPFDYGDVPAGPPPSADCTLDEPDSGVFVVVDRSPVRSPTAAENRRTSSMLRESQERETTFPVAGSQRLESTAQLNANILAAEDDKNSGLKTQSKVMSSQAQRQLTERAAASSPLGSPRSMMMSTSSVLTGGAGPATNNNTNDFRPKSRSRSSLAVPSVVPSHLKSQWPPGDQATMLSSLKAVDEEGRGENSSSNGAGNNESGSDIFKRASSKEKDSVLVKTLSFTIPATADDDGTTRGTPGSFAGNMLMDNAASVRRSGTTTTGYIQQGQLAGGDGELPEEHERYTRRRSSYFTVLHEGAIKERNKKFSVIVERLVRQSDARVEKFLHDLEKAKLKVQRPTERGRGLESALGSQRLIATVVPGA